MSKHARGHAKPWPGRARTYREVLSRQRCRAAAREAGAGRQLLVDLVDVVGNVVERFKEEARPASRAARVRIKRAPGSNERQLAFLFCLSSRSADVPLVLDGREALQRLLGFLPSALELVVDRFATGLDILQPVMCPFAQSRPSAPHSPVRAPSIHPTAPSRPYLSTARMLGAMRSI